MKITCKILLVFPVILILTQCTQKQIKYLPSWESLEQCNPAPEWFKDAKFGIYFHWGVYSVSAEYEHCR